jgi:hypothetical protein
VAAEMATVVGAAAFSAASRLQQLRFYDTASTWLRIARQGSFEALRAAPGLPRPFSAAVARPLHHSLPLPWLLQQAIENEQMSKLREYIESLGGNLDGSWRCRASIRDYGSRAGSMDTWFTAPHGETFRSKVAVRVRTAAGKRARGSSSTPLGSAETLPLCQAARHSRQPAAASLLVCSRAGPLLRLSLLGFYTHSLQVARGLGLDPGAAPKPRASRRLPVDPDRPRPPKLPRPPKEATAAGQFRHPLLRVRGNAGWRRQQRTYA